MPFSKWTVFSYQKSRRPLSPQRCSLRRRKTAWQMLKRHCLFPRLEALESRVMLATLIVDTAEDLVDGDVTSISALIDDPGGDKLISLREAILAANVTADADEINFGESLAGLPINLIQGELVVTDELSITGLGASQTIIDAGGNSRIL